MICLRSQSAKKGVSCDHRIDQQRSSQLLPVRKLALASKKMAKHFNGEPIKPWPMPLLSTDYSQPSTSQTYSRFQDRSLAPKRRICRSPPFKMKTATLLALMTGLIASVFADPVTFRGMTFPEGTVIQEFPNGLPKYLRPRALGLQKRDIVGVTLCQDLSFVGNCLRVTGPSGLCSTSTPLSALKELIHWDGNKDCMY